MKNISIRLSEEVHTFLTEYAPHGKRSKIIQEAIIESRDFRRWLINSDPNHAYRRFVETKAQDEKFSEYCALRPASVPSTTEDRKIQAQYALLRMLREGLI